MNTIKNQTTFNLALTLLTIFLCSCSSNPAATYYDQSHFVLDDESNEFILEGKKSAKITSDKIDLYLAFADYWRLNQIFHIKVKNNSDKNVTISPEDFYISGDSAYDTEKNVTHLREARGINPVNEIAVINKQLNYLRNDSYSGLEYFGEFVDTFTKNTEDKAERVREREKKKAKIEKDIREEEEKKRVYSQMFKPQTLLPGETFQSKVMIPLLRGVIEQKMKINLNKKDYTLYMKQNISIEYD